MKTTIHALGFLMTRQLFNGLKRTVTSGRRLVAFLFAISYYFWIFFRPLGSRTYRGSMPSQVSLPDPAAYIQQHTGFDSVTLMSTLVFMLYAFATPMILLLILGSGRPSFKRADVDILFPTPVDRRVLMTLRFFFATLGTSLIPILLGVVMIRPFMMDSGGVTSATMQLSRAFGITRTAYLAWFMDSTLISCAGIALGIYLQRFEQRSKYVNRIGAWVAVGLLVFLGLLVRQAVVEENIGVIVTALKSPALRAVYFPAEINSWITLAPMNGDWGRFGVGVVILGGLGILSYFLALRQEGWVYDLAAGQTAATQEIMEPARRGDYYAVLAAKARSGKLRTRKIGLIDRWSPQKEWAILWREAVILFRGQTILQIFPVLYPLAILFLIRSAGSHSRHPERLGTVTEYGAIIAIIFTAWFGAMMTSSTFAEMLRRGDLLKPLPFAPGRTIFMEILSRTITQLVQVVLVAAVCIAFYPAMWASLAVAILVAVGLAVAVASGNSMVTLLLPDIDDPTQRGFRGLMQMLLIVIIMAIPIGMFMGAKFVNMPLQACLLLTLPVLIIEAAICSTIAGRLYTDFNPAD